jgi:AraC-like DNA-binding protein
MLLSLVERMAELPADLQRQRRLLAVLVDELQAAEEEQLYLPMPRDARLRLLANALAADPADQRGLDAWSEQLGVSKRSLVRHFRDQTGLSFTEWRQRARIIRAIPLLAKGSSVTEAALAVGYDSLSAFSTLFRHLVGVAPGQYLGSSAVAAPAFLN